MASALNPMPAEAGCQPRRVMGFRDLLFFYVVTGISLRWIASAAAAGPSALIVWIAAWLLFYVPLALSVIGLASRYPGEGGLYLWSKQAFGDLPGFLCGWIYWCSYFPYLPAALYFAAGNALYIRFGRWGHLSQHPTYYVVFSLVALTALSFLNLVGLNVGRWLHDAGALAMWIPAAIIFVMGLIAWRRFGAANSFEFHSILPATGFKEMMFWSILIFAFGGCEAASFMGAEIKGTRRTLPLALLAGGATVALTYILGTWGILLALPAGEVSNLQGLMQAVSRTADRTGLAGVVPVTAALITLSGVAAVSAFMAATARLPFVAGMDHVLPPAFASLHPRWRTPWVALLVESGVGVVFLLLGQFQDNVKGAYDVLVSIGVITYFIPYGFLFAAAFKLEEARWSRRFLALVGMLTTTLAIVLSSVPRPGAPHKLLVLTKVVGAIVVLTGAGAFIYWKGKSRSQLRQR